MNAAIAKLFSSPGTPRSPQQQSAGWAVQPEGRKKSRVLRAKEAELKTRCRRGWEVCGKKSLRIHVVDSWAHQREGFVKKDSGKDHHNTTKKCFMKDQCC